MSNTEDRAAKLIGEEAKVHADAPAPTQRRLGAETGQFSLIGRAIGTHLEQHNANGGIRVESQPADGGKAVSEAAADRSFRVELTGHLLRGEDGEPRAVRILIAKLRSLGHEVIELPEAENERGEDRKLSIDAAENVVQVVTLPIDNEVWKKLGDKGTAEMLGHDAVRLLRACIEKKCHKAKRAILVLDAAHIGALASQDLVDAYLKAHGDPSKECGFTQTWIVGPTEARTFAVKAV